MKNYSIGVLSLGEVILINFFTVSDKLTTLVTTWQESLRGMPFWNLIWNLACTRLLIKARYCFYCLGCTLTAKSLYMYDFRRFVHFCMCTLCTGGIKVSMMVDRWEVLVCVKTSHFHQNYWVYLCCVAAWAVNQLTAPPSHSLITFTRVKHLPCCVYVLCNIVTTSGTC